jgi:phage terminase large subunit
MKLDLKLQPKQMRLLDMVDTLGTPRNIAYGGARGGSKSHAARAVNLIRRLKYPGTNSLFLRKTYPELLSNHIQPMFAQWPQLRRYFNSQTKTLTLPTNPPSITEFRTADDSGRIARIQGSEFLDVFIDEATQFDPLDLIWLQTVNRYVGPHNVEPHTVLTANPGGIGHSYIKRVYVDREFRENERSRDYDFLQAYGQDNVEWARAALEKDGLTADDYYAWSDEKRLEYFVTRTQYGQVLNALPDALRGPHLFGDWNFFAGQYFDIFDPKLHVVELADVKMQPWWPKWIAMDWGWSDDTAIYWLTSDPNGKTYVYREVVVNNLTGDKLGGLIGEITKKAGETIEEFDLSRDAFAHKQSERTVADELGDVVETYGIPRPQFADQDRIGGWQLCYQLLQAGQLVITKNCPRLIAVVPTLIRDVPNNPNDVLAVSGDDPADAWRYGIKTRARRATKPHDLVVREKLAGLQNLDPTSAMIAIRRIMGELEDQDAPKMLAPYTIQEEMSDVG